MPNRASVFHAGRNGRRRGVLLALALTLVLVLPAGSGDAAPMLKVWFLKGEQMVPVERPGSTATDAVTALLAGPTASERSGGFRTYVPRGTTLNGVTIVNGVA